jgi:hypothetical protein
MLRSFLIAVLCVGVLATNASAVIVAYLDEFDDAEMINTVADAPKVKVHRENLQGLSKSLLKLDQVSITAVLNKPAEKRRKTYAMPLGETRSIALSGIHDINDKQADEDFVSFHPVGDFAAVEFYYSRQREPGDVPLAARIYLKVDETFPKLTKDNLDERLAWDRTQLRKLAKQVGKKANELPSGASGTELKDLVDHFGKGDQTD